MSKRRVTSFVVLLFLAAGLRAHGQEAGTPLPHRLSLPDKNWALDVTLSALDRPASPDPAGDPKAGKGPHFLPPAPKDSLSEDGREYQSFTFLRFDKKHPDNFGHVSIKLRSARPAVGAEELRALLLKGISEGWPVKAGGVKTWEYKQVPVARYTFMVRIDGGNGWTGPMPMVNKGARNLEAYLVREDVWITLTLTARDVGEREERLFYALLDSLKFVDTSAPSSSFDFYHKGRVLYMRKDYRQAVRALTMALNMEQQQRRLDTPSWRGLVGNLADSYGALGEIPRAKEILDYAAANDPEYPVFQLALARYHARLGDLDNTIAFLEKAFKNGVSDGLDSPLPNPAWDPAFDQFRKNERFRKALKALKK